MGKILNSIIRILATVFIILLLVYLFVTTRQIGKEIFSDQAKDSEITAVEASITVHEGESLMSIGKKLQEKEIINNAYYFVIACRFSDDYENIQPGDYTLNSSMKPSEILESMLPKEETE